MKINELKRNLKESSKEALIQDIVDLFKKNDFVKDYYRSKYAAADNLTILIKHKDIIENEFFPKKGDGKGRLAIAKKAITEFNKLSKDKVQTAELMIFYVETGVRYTEVYGDIDEAFYLSMESMYERAMKFVVLNNLADIFKDRLFAIVNTTVDMGWGFHDQLCEIYYGSLSE